MNSDPPARKAAGLRGLDPRELLCRALSPPRLSGGAPESWDPPSPRELAPQFPGYEMLDLLGRGGMGAVYRARQLSLGRLVAIKILPVELSLHAELAARFHREAQALARLAHPHIVRVYDFGQTPDGHFFFVMEFVEGSDLEALLRQGPIAVPRVLEMMRQVCEALEAAHTEGLVHRDVKPSNILIDARGCVKISDFGLTRFAGDGDSDSFKTLAGAVLGTPEYMAPEQARDGAVDHRADIYSLGVILYEMLTGCLPRGIFEPPSKSTRVNARVDKVVRRALQSEPGRRYQRAGEMGRELHSTGLRPLRRTPAACLAGAMAVVGIATLVTFQPWKSRRDGIESSFPVTNEPIINSLGQRFVPAGTPGVLFCVWETRVRDFETFVAETGHRVPPGVSHMVGSRWVEHPDADWRAPPGFVQTPDHPVVGVAWNDAVQFGRWLTQRELRAGRIKAGDVYRLPSDAEWSVAAGLPPKDATTLPTKEHGFQGIYPWGTEKFPPPAGIGNFAGEEMHIAGLPRSAPVITGYRDGYTGPSPVGTFRAQRHGLFDLGGNVAEWTADSHPQRAEVKLVRGGSWAVADGATLRSASRSTWNPELRTTGGGFRVVLARAR